MATKQAALSKAAELAAQVNAALGANTVKMGNHADYKVEYRSTGLLPFDILLMGGLPRGRHVELYGDYSTLKSYMGYCSIAEAQKRGEVCALIDTEHAFERTWAEAIGVDVDNLIMPPTATGEEAMDAAEALVRGNVDVIVVDSIAATLPQAEATKRLHKESMQPARQAQLMSAALRRLTAANAHTSFIWINQTRLNIGVTFGSPEAIPGGKAMPYYASYRIKVNKTGKVTRDARYFTGEKWENGKEQIAQRYKAEVVKSKLSKPFRDIWFTWDLRSGQIDLPSFLVAQAVEVGIVTLTGNSWQYGGKKVVGREKFLTAVASDPTIMASLESDVRSFHGLPGLVTVPGATGAPAARQKVAQARRKTLRKVA